MLIFLGVYQVGSTIYTVGKHAHVKPVFTKISRKQ